MSGPLQGFRIIDLTSVISGPLATMALADQGAEAQSVVELIYQTRDGWMAVSAHTDRSWAGLAAALNRPDWPGDPRFATVALREETKAARLGSGYAGVIQRKAFTFPARRYRSYKSASRGPRSTAPWPRSSPSMAINGI